MLSLKIPDAIWLMKLAEEEKEGDMKKFFVFLLAAILVLSAAGCGGDAASQEKSGRATAASGEANKESAEAGGKILVAYFSATGTTKPIAENLARATGADLFEIVPKDAYSDEDLNYNSDNCRANREQQDENARPEIAGAVENMEQYDTVFIGHPIWWGEEPRIIDTFVESYDLSGKTVVDFCTSGGSGNRQSENNLKKLCPDNVTWLPGQRFESGADMEAVTAWLDELGI